MFFDYYMMGIILLPGILLAIYAQTKVMSTFKKFNQVLAQCGRTASEVARLFLDNAGLHHIKIVKVRGHLTDYYDHKKQIIALSESVHDSQSIASIGIACHEVGHAIQYKTRYAPIMLRNWVIHVCSITDKFLWLLILVGALLYYTPLGMYLIWIGVGIFALSVILNLITLPCEYNASKRATHLLQQSTILSPAETEGANKVLKSAALTYVASLVISLLNLLRFVLSLLVTGSRD